MAGTDFSTRTYSYDDFPGDDSLLMFSLTEEDLVYKVYIFADFYLLGYILMKVYMIYRFLMSRGPNKSAQSRSNCLLGTIVNSVDF